DSEFATVVAQSLDLFGSDRIGNRQISIGSRHIVIDCRDCQIRPSHGSTGSAQTVEFLWRSHFVNEMKIDIKKARLARRSAHNVCIPNFFEECARHSKTSYLRELHASIQFIQT